MATGVVVALALALAPPPSLTPAAADQRRWPPFPVAKWRANSAQPMLMANIDIIRASNICGQCEEAYRPHNVPKSDH